MKAAITLFVRLIESLGMKVLRLVRLEFGPISLGDMKAGRHRVSKFTRIN